MLIQSKAFGEIEIEDIQVIAFEDGILGFAEYHRYALLDSHMDSQSGQLSPFKWLQSLDDQDLAFVTIEPNLFYPDYKPKCSDEDVKKILLEKAGDAVVLSIVTIPENPEKMTANLQGPILINREKHIGVQAISLDEKHGVRHSILEMLNFAKSAKNREGN